MLKRFPTSICIILAFLLTVSQPLECNFNNYISKFSKTYVVGSAEYRYRSLIYEANCTIINEINSNPNSGYTLQETKCTDLTQDQCKKEFNLKFVDVSELPHAEVIDNSLRVSSPVVATTPPSSLNYYSLGHSSSVKNQGSCGCCWAFASVAAYQSWLSIKGHGNIGISEQASLECTYTYAPNRRMSDCTEGYIVDAMETLAKVGGVLRSSYPYTAGSRSSGLPSTAGICSEQNRIYLGNGTTQLFTTLSTAQLKQKLTDNGPFMVGIYANAGFMSYSSGTYGGCPANAASLINHAVQLIGYDSSNNWIIKNQWGTTWGESGFMTVSNTFDCGLRSLVIGINFGSYNVNVSQTFDPTVYQTKATSSQTYLLGIFVLMITVLLI